MSETTTYTVQGMTCGHCVGTVTEAVTALDGVTSVDVDLATGAVTVVSDGRAEPASVRATVEDAGYDVA